MTVILLSIIVVGFLTLGCFVAGVKYGELNADRHFLGLNRDRILPITAITTIQNVFNDWTSSVKTRHVIDRKIGSISLADSLIGDPSDHIFLGVFERDVLKRKSEAALHFYLATANGHPDAYRLYRDLNVPTEDYETLYQLFIEIHQLNGDLGLERLGQYYLGKDVFKIAKRMRTRLRFTEPSDYIWPRQPESADLAYIQFQMASLCGLTSAFEWRAETAKYYNITDAHQNTLKQRANAGLKELAERYGSGRNADQDDYCKREHLKRGFEDLRKDFVEQVGARYEEALEFWTGGHPCDYEDHGMTDDECDGFDSYIDGSGAFKLSVAVPNFRDLLEEFIDGRGRRRGGGGGGGGGGGPRGGGGGGGGPKIDEAASPLYRAAPGGEATDNQEPVALPETRDACVKYNQYGDCELRESALACNDQAKRQFNLGEADMAIGRTINARGRFERAIAIGRGCQSEYAVLAAKRLAALNLTCEYTPESLARISRDFANNPDGGALIDMESRQRALAAKGYYEGKIDGRYGSGTREGVRQFQRELGTNETGDLTPIETVYLICSAAEVHADLKSINTLGIMYIAGLGVVQNTDRGLDLLKQAAERGDTDSMYNLALIYGTGTVFSSYRLCANVQNIQIADSWLDEAAERGHGPADRLWELFGQFTPTERWDRIKAELQLNDFYLDRLELVGEACTPNP